MTRILFIDDDVLTLQLMSRIAGLLGYQALVSYSAQDGLRLAAQEKPSMIIVDMQMSDMNGIEFVRRARQNPELTKLPLLICSADGNQQLEEKARREGATAYLTKPLGPDEMIRVVKQYSNGTIGA